MIYLGPAGLPTITKGDTIDGLKDISNLNLNAMEIEFVRNVYLNKEQAIEIGNLAKKLHIILSIHASYFINLCNPEKIEASKERILSSCVIGNYINAKYIVFHPGYYGNLSAEEAYEFVRKGCIELSKLIKKNKLNVFLGLETTGKKSQFGTLDEILKICKEIKICRPVVDFAHIYARNGGKINYSEIFDKLEKFSYLHTHFSGIEFTDKGERRHIPISSKHPDFDELAKELVNRGFTTKKRDIVIISESPVLEQDSLKMMKILKKYEK